MTDAIDIPTLTAGQMADAIRSGELTPTQIVEVLLERIDGHDEKTRAFSHLDREEVLAEAKLLAQEAASGKFRGPLHGVPFGVKEQFLLEGVPTLGDFSDPSPETAAYTATVVTRLKDAGAIVMGKTFMTGPAGHPPSRNPWNTAHTPGGSSSGSGAAVGARYVPFALSEQTGGSGIRPAAYCGVSGLKPTYGRNSRYGMFQLVYSTDHPCIIATDITEVERIFSVTAGHDPLDPSSRPDAAYTGKVELTGPPKIGVVRNFFPELQDDEMNDAIQQAADQMAAAGAEVVDFLLPEDWMIVWANQSLVAMAEGGVLSMKIDERRAEKGLPHRSTYPKAMESRAKFGGTKKELGDLLPATYYLQAQRVRRWYQEKMTKALEGYDAILMATAPGQAPKQQPPIAGDDSLLRPWSHLGNPAISIPAPVLSADGMPLGLQLVGRMMEDEHLLAVGAWAQGVLGTLPAPELP
jgi:aspartyl-tRNA(Asn)/glutamyl-tRNA(Gln) amidotransferase subunit A